MFLEIWEKDSGLITKEKEKEPTVDYRNLHKLMKKVIFHGKFDVDLGAYGMKRTLPLFFQPAWSSSSSLTSWCLPGCWSSPAAWWWPCSTPWAGASATLMRLGGRMGLSTSTPSTSCSLQVRYNFVCRNRMQSYKASCREWIIQSLSLWMALQPFLLIPSSVILKNGWTAIHHDTFCNP